MALNKVLKATTNSELMSYIINVTPELKSEIDLPVQGESIKPIGELIVNNERYRNAFINTVNLIGLTVIKRNAWENPWDFTTKGTLRRGQQIRELILDLCDVFDYNKNVNNHTKFLQNAVPDVYHHIHEVNFQKVYETTISEDQMLMAFEDEGSLLDFIGECTLNLYDTYQYDMYIVDKYMLCRRILDGTVPAMQIEDYENLSSVDKVSAIKAISNLMTFKKPYYNPAGIRRATPFRNQKLIVNTDFEADYSTKVLAGSFFKNEAELKSSLALIDTFNEHDEERLQYLLEEAYIPFTSAEKEQLAEIPAMLISDDFFMDYDYAFDTVNATKQTEFTNPSTLKKNMFLHVWRVFSTSPFANCMVFTQTKPSITSVNISPSTATVSKGQSLQLTANVVTAGFANKAVQWSVTQGDNVTVDLNGLVTIPSDFTGATVKIKATSIYDKTKSSTATITVA